MTKAEDDDWEIFRRLRSARKQLRTEFCKPCPVCIAKLPKAPPTLLLPQQKCKIHGYKDPRPRIRDDEVNRVYGQFGLTREKHDVKFQR